MNWIHFFYQISCLLNVTELWSRWPVDVRSDMLSLLVNVLPSSSGTHIRVLVFIDSMEIEGLVVDEELCAGNVDRADANR